MNAQELEQRRLRAVKLLKRGRRPAEVARELGCTAGAVSQWKKRFDDKGGRKALQARQHCGPISKLTPHQQKQLVRLLAPGPYGRPRRWTLRRVQETIQREFGIRYERSGVLHLLRRLGWFFQPGKRASAEELQAWRQRVYAAAAEEVGPDGQTLGIAMAMIQHPSPRIRSTWAPVEKPRQKGASDPPLSRRRQAGP